MSISLAGSLLIAGIGAGIKGISSGITSRREKDSLERQADNMETLIGQYKDLLDKNEMTLSQVMTRLDAHFTAQGGRLKSWYDEQMKLGTEQITSQLGATIDQINFGLDQAKTRSDRQERDFNEQDKEKTKQIQEDFENSNQDIKDQAVKGRLSFSGAFLASMEKSQQVYSKLQANMAQSKSRFFRGLSEQFGDVVKNAGFQTLQAQGAAGRSTLGLQAQIGGQFQQAQTALAGQQFGAGEAARGQALTQDQNMLALQAQADALREGGQAINPFGSALMAGASGIGQGLTGIGLDLFGANLKNKLPGTAFDASSLTLGG